MLVAAVAFVGVAAAAVAQPASPRKAPVRRAGPHDPRVRPRGGVTADPPWLGIGIASGQQGVKVTEVIEGTPAAQAGLRVDDEILTIEGNAIRTDRELVGDISMRRSGDVVRLGVARGARRFVLRATLAPRLDEQEVLERRRLDKAAPGFELPIAVPGMLSGKADTLKLEALRGNVVVIEFLATWCGPCKSTYKTLSDLAARRAGEGLIVLGISGESEAALRALAGQEPISFSLLRDGGDAIRAAYGAHATPTLIVVDREGIVRYAGMGAGLPVDHAIFAAERALGDAKD